MQQSRSAFVCRLALIGTISACGGGDGTGPAVAASVAINPASLTLNGVGVTGTLAATVLDARGAAISDALVTWVSDNPSVASVSGTENSATITGLANGSTTIRAKSGTVEGVATVTVNARVLQLTVSPKPVTIDRGSTQQMSAAVVADPGVSTTVSWQSNNTTAVSVSSTGLATAVNPGSAYIIATASAEPGKRDSALVTVRDACAAPQAYSLGTSVNGSITIADCQSGRWDQYDFSLSSATLFSVTVTPATADMQMSTFVGEVLWGWTAFLGTSTPRYFLGSVGPHRISVGVSDTTQRQTYTFSTTPNPTFPSTCPIVMTTLAVTWSSALSSTCPAYLPSGLTGSFRMQWFEVTLPLNRPFRATVVATGYRARIELKDPFNVIITSAFAAAPGTPAVLTYTSPTYRGAYLYVTSQTSGALGSYTITIDP